MGRASEREKLRETEGDGERDRDGEISRFVFELFDCRYIPTLEEMGWAPSPKTRHEQNALDLTKTEAQHKNLVMAAPPTVTSSSSSNVSISRTSSARNRYANNVKNTLR